MDWLHLWGVENIKWMQETFKDNSEEMLVLSHAGDPRNAFLIYFPLAYFLDQTTGIQVMWVAAISEWMNAILKWMLFGQRPYWWVNELDLHGNMKVPQLQQFRLTCETGPGSPSGHAMVTSAVFVTMIIAYLHRNLKETNSRSAVERGIIWTLYVVLMVLVSLSRCYISAHFPHQVVAGVFTGIIIAYISQIIDYVKVPLSGYTVVSLSLLLSGPVFYWLIDSLGFDPMWTVSLAKKWCANPEWVHLDTNLFYALSRDASALFGLGVALRCKTTLNVPEIPALPTRIVAVVISVAFTRGLELFILPQSPRLLFYSLAFLKNIAVPLFIVLIVPKVVGICTKIKNS